MSGTPRRVAAGAARRLLGTAEDSLASLVWRRLDETPELRPAVETYTDELARMHEGVPLERESLRRVTRYFHAWRVETLRRRIGDRIAGSRMLDVGDTDGLILKHLGKTGTGFNISEVAVRNIRSHGVEAVQGDGHALPFDDSSFDDVICFETLEHVEEPHRLLCELARVVRPEGRVWISIPWVPHTNVWPRGDGERGAAHVFELSREHFHALVTHTPLRIEWEDVCDVVGAPSTLRERVFTARQRGHIVAGTFRRFQFFELVRR